MPCSPPGNLSHWAQLTTRVNDVGQITNLTGVNTSETSHDRSTGRAPIRRRLQSPTTATAMKQRSPGLEDSLSFDVAFITAACLRSVSLCQPYLYMVTSTLCSQNCDMFCRRDDTFMTWNAHQCCAAPCDQCDLLLNACDRNALSTPTVGRGREGGRAKNPTCSRTQVESDLCYTKKNLSMPQLKVGKHGKTRHGHVQGTHTIDRLRHRVKGGDRTRKTRGEGMRSKGTPASSKGKEYSSCTR